MRLLAIMWVYVDRWASYAWYSHGQNLWYHFRDNTGTGLARWAMYKSNSCDELLYWECVHLGEGQNPPT